MKKEMMFSLDDHAFQWCLSLSLFAHLIHRQTHDVLQYSETEIQTGPEHTILTIINNTEFSSTEDPTQDVTSSQSLVEGDSHCKSVKERSFGKVCCGLRDEHSSRSVPVVVKRLLDLKDHLDFLTHSVDQHGSALVDNGTSDLRVCKKAKL
jgi:hypothetical protein